MEASLFPYCQTCFWMSCSTNQYHYTIIYLLLKGYLTLKVENDPKEKQIIKPPESHAQVTSTISHVFESVNILDKMSYTCMEISDPTSYSVVQSHQSVLLPVDTKIFKKTQFVCLGGMEKNSTNTTTKILNGYYSRYWSCVFP